MKQYNEDIKLVMDNALQQCNTSVQFEDLWNIVINNRQKTPGTKKIVRTRLVAVLAVFVLLMVGFTGYNIIRRIDRVDYPFIDDPRVLGKWESVDFVNNIKDFDSGKKYYKEKLYLESLVFIKDGKLLVACGGGNLVKSNDIWTKDMILCKQDRTAGKYLIEDIDGTSYMFFEWKNGDYVFNNRFPRFYVLKKIDNKDYSNYQAKPIKEDKIDYPFVDSAEMRGRWESVDFVQTTDSFTPGVRVCPNDLYIMGLDFKRNGKLTITTSSGISSMPSITWTNGLVINKRSKIASRCEIKEINGTKYMFFEWKPSNYLYGGTDIDYYVLKKN